MNKYSNVVCADKKYRSRLPVPFGLYAAVSWPALPSSLCGRSPARFLTGDTPARIITQRY
ncbi:hypothetical protein BEI64_17675 [Eisenbergiella tayi]|nr:hypothetical protein BEI64_17675 [Eisenbergiella tayi]